MEWNLEDLPKPTNRLVIINLIVCAVLIISIFAIVFLIAGNDPNHDPQVSSGLYEYLIALCVTFLLLLISAIINARLLKGITVIWIKLLSFLPAVILVFMFMYTFSCFNFLF